jgi:rhodanese-related sulfurtransferase
MTVLGTSAAQPADAEAGWYKNIVDFKFVQEVATIPVRADVMIIDSRPTKRRYDPGHIPGAVSVPDSRFDKMANVLPEDKSKLLVFYCGGVKCPLSHKSAFKAEALGYTNIKVYAAGYPDWLKKGEIGSVSAAYVKRIVDKPDGTVIVDARPKKRKYDKGHVPGAISIPDRSFDKMTDLLPADKKTPLLFYCGGLKCPLSLKSAVKAVNLGFENVRVFQGGYPAWKAAYGPGPGGSVQTM